MSSFKVARCAIVHMEAAMYDDFIAFEVGEGMLELLDPNTGEVVFTCVQRKSKRENR